LGLIILQKLDGGLKSEIHGAICYQLMKQLGWDVLQKVHCVVNGNVFTADVGAWKNRPTRAQQQFPIIAACPPPDIWIEVSSFRS
jgi:hypothetical protein